MGFLDDRPVPKITAAVVLVATVGAYLTSIIPEGNSEVITLIIGAASTYLFTSNVAKV